MSFFNANDHLDVRCLCSVMAKTNGELYLQHLSLEEIMASVTEPILFKISDDGYYSFMPEEIRRVIALDDSYRLSGQPEDALFTIVVPSDDVYYDMDLTTLNALVSQGIKFAIHTPSKVVASVPGVYYSHETDHAWQFDSTLQITQVPGNGMWIGSKPIDGVPHLATGLDNKLIYERDEQYLDMLRAFDGGVFVLDELSKFLLADEGIESETLM